MAALHYYKKGAPPPLHSRPRFLLQQRCCKQAAIPLFFVWPRADDRWPSLNCHQPDFMAHLARAYRQHCGQFCCSLSPRPLEVFVTSATFCLGWAFLAL